MNYANLRRRYQAAIKDRTPGRFHAEIKEALATGQLKPSDFRLRPLFESIVEGGSEIVQSWNPGQGGQGGISLQEADANTPVNLLEAGATVSSSFSNITGQIIYNAILEKYQDEQFVITPLVTTVPTQFNGEKIAGIQRLADNFESIGENQPYPIAGVSEDYIQTPQTVKRGEIVPVSKEAIFFDRTGLILERCGEVGYYYGVNKEKRLIDAVIDQNVTTHRYNWKGTSYANFQTSTPWINSKTTNALSDWTSIDALELLMSQLLDPGTGEPISIVPKHLIVARQLKLLANQIMYATQVRRGDGVGTTGATTIGPSPLEFPYQVVSSALLSARQSANTTWYIGDISKAVKYMENWPMTVVQAPSNSEAEFTQDIVLRWKCSERGAAVVVQPRALVQSTP
jgi:hypothetical protein